MQLFPTHEISKESICKILTLRRPASFEDSRAKTTGSHVALLTHNSGGESGRELFKGSKDVASLLVCTHKKIFWLGGADFL